MAMCVENILSGYSTLEQCYDAFIIPVLDGDRQMPDAGADWIFEYLTLCRIIKPERYEELKQRILQHIETLVKRKYPEPNVKHYYHNLDEIFKYMESLSMDELKKGKKK